MPSIYDILMSGGNPAVLAAQQIANPNNAISQGAVQGVNDYATTIQKAVTPFTYPAASQIPIIGQYARNPDQVQSDYLQQLNQYNNNPAVKANPLLAGAGRVGAQTAIAAPLFAAAGASGLGLTTAGVLSAGAMNSPTQGDSLFNVKNAAYALPVAAVGGAIQSSIPIVKNAVSTVAPTLAKKAGMTASDIEPLITGMTDNTSGMVDAGALTSAINKVAPESSASSILNGWNMISGLYKDHFVSGPGAGAAIGTALGSLVGQPGAGAAVGAAVGGGIKLAPKVLNAMFNNGSLSSTLKLIANTGDTLFSNPGATALILNRLNSQLTNAGINVMLNSANGDMELRQDTSGVTKKSTPVDNLKAGSLEKAQNSPAKVPTKQDLQVAINSTPPQSVPFVPQVNYKNSTADQWANIYLNNNLDPQAVDKNDPTSLFSVRNGKSNG